MYKYGFRDAHSYVLSVRDKKNQAITDAENEHEDRGEKYMPEVIEIEGKDQKVILKLKKSGCI